MTCRIAVIDASLKVPDMTAVNKKLSEVSSFVKNSTRANRDMSLWLHRWVDKNFRSQGGAVGQWKKFKAGGRRKKGGGIDTSAKLLQDTGALRLSFHEFYGRTMAGIGSDLSYSISHEKGIPERNLPARRMLPRETDKTVIDALLKIYGRHVTRVINR